MLRRCMRVFASIQHVPSIKEFMRTAQNLEKREDGGYPQFEGWKYYVETYGCQMNSNDSAIVESVLQSAGLAPTPTLSQANLLLVNTCAVRDHAEQKIWQRLYEFRSLRKKGHTHLVAVLGCMAERLKEKLITKEKLAHIVAGPDSYRNLPALLEAVRNSGEAAMDVQLSQEETYADITPVRTASSGVTASISIMRGCNNMCSFCVVPFTRGRERSRQKATILQEVKKLEEQGVREIMFLGQNVNSYVDGSSEGEFDHENTTGFAEMYKLRDIPGARFADLLTQSAQHSPSIRFRFTSPHPKDFPQPLLDTIRLLPNVCKQIHLPLQSGSTDVLTRMRRGYTREAYLDLVRKIRSEIPGVSISTDLIAGFCGESESDHSSTLSLLKDARFEQAFMFAYSKRPRTHAANNYEDDVPQHTKLRRLQEIIDLQRQIQRENNEAEVGKEHVVLVEGTTKRKEGQFTGKTDTGKRVVVDVKEGDAGVVVGGMKAVRIVGASPQTLFGVPT